MLCSFFLFLANIEQDKILNKIIVTDISKKSKKSHILVFFPFSFDIAQLFI